MSNTQFNEQKDKLNTIQEKLLESQEICDKKIKELSSRLRDELKDLVDLQAETLSFRQQLVDEKTKYWYNIIKIMPQLKNKHKEYFEFYSAKYQFKTNGGEKLKLIESDLAYHNAKIELLKNHIQYLEESTKTVDNINYGIKNKIDIYNITGLD